MGHRAQSEGLVDVEYVDHPLFVEDMRVAVRDGKVRDVELALHEMRKRKPTYSQADASTQDAAEMNDGDLRALEAKVRAGPQTAKRAGARAYRQRCSATRPQGVRGARSTSAAPDR